MLAAPSGVLGVLLPEPPIESRFDCETSILGPFVGDMAVLKVHHLSATKLSLIFQGSLNVALGFTLLDALTLVCLLFTTCERNSQLQFLTFIIPP